MIDVIGYWMALTLLVLPPLYWICVALEESVAAYVKSLTVGRYSMETKLLKYYSSRGEYARLWLAVLSTLYVIFWLTSLLASFTQGTLTFMEMHEIIATNLTWVFWPVMIGIVLFFVHKILKKVVDFGYRVHDKLEK